jgi:MFS family permease
MKRSKITFFGIELINCYAVIFYSNFLFFYMKTRFGFNDLENLLLAALNGFIYMFAAWQGGAFAQRHGYIRSIYIGFFGIALSMVCGLFLGTVTGQVIAFAGWSVSVCFIWPALEAIVSEDSGGDLSKMVGLYNITWATGGSIAYFTAGMVLEHLGMQSLFWLPLLLTGIQLILLTYARRLMHNEPHEVHALKEVITPQQAIDNKRFLYMAWLANPLSYVASNTLIPLIPSITGKLGLSTAMAGIVCSTWMFSRLAAFYILWRWTGWHYRHRWMLGAFIVMTISFIFIIPATSVVVLVAAQIGFGLSIGLIYYSSLYYAMHASEGDHGAHGGKHEAMIGIGLFVGPAFGASSIAFFPHGHMAGMLAVSIVLIVGFAVLLRMSRSGREIKT